MISNANEQVIQTSRLLTGGRYWVGLGHGILTFPRQMQAIVFSDTNLANTADSPSVFPSLGARTNEGLIIYVQLAAHYQLTIPTSSMSLGDQLGDIYAKFGSDWVSYISPIIEAGAKDVCGRHGFSDFYQIRSSIETEMLSTIAPDFTLNHFQLFGIYILDVTFQQSLEAAVQATEDANQQVQYYQKLQTQEEILRDTKILVANMTKTMIMSTADAIVNSTNIQNNGAINSANYIWNSYYNILNALAVYISIINCF